MSSCSAASRREAPPSTRAITRMRMSAEYAFGVVRPPANQCGQTRLFTGPWESCDSIRQEHALDAWGRLNVVTRFIIFRRTATPFARSGHGPLTYPHPLVGAGATD